MKSEEQVRKQRREAYEELVRISRTQKPGSGAWREQRRYIDALDWVLSEE